MKRRLIRAIKSESGQALPTVLVLLLLGGLLIAPSLSYASTSLKVGQIVEKNVKGLYAADAGVENALWCIKNSFPSPGPLNINQMPVAVDIFEDERTYTLYYGDLIVVGDRHYDYLTVDGEMVWDELAQAYKYTITVTWQPTSGYPIIHLEEIGVRLPVGYEYVLDSADSFPDNLSADEPDDPVEQDQAGAYMLNWELPPPRPAVSDLGPTRTQTFYVTGEGSQDGDYTWVEAGREDIGQVGEVTGKRYRITATATIPGDGEITAIVTADAMVYETGGEITEITIIRWQINPE